MASPTNAKRRSAQRSDHATQHSAAVRMACGDCCYPACYVKERAGQADEVAPVATNAQRLADAVSNAEMNIYSDAGHYVFLNACTSRGKRYVPVCKDASSVDRVAIHEDAAAQIESHFDSVFAME